MNHRSVRDATEFVTSEPNRDQASPHSVAREIAAAAVGNALEWFDFVIYGYFATIIAKLFFPEAGAFGSLLLATATFGVGFVVRPFGGFIFGLYADKAGRKKALSLTIWLMMVGTGLIAIAPTYRQAGWLGAIVLVTARLIQGLAASGEYGSAVAFLAEKAPTGRRNFYVSLQMSTTMLAIVLGGAVGALLTKSLSQTQLESWGWRVPFVIGLLIGPVGFYMRRHVEETKAFSQARKLPTGKILGQLVGQQRSIMLAAIGVSIVGTVAFYLNLVYMPTFAVRELGLPMSAPFASTAVAGLVMVICAPAAGLLSDIAFRSVTILSVAIAAIALITYPLYTWLIAHPTMSNLLVVQGVLAVPMGIISGLIPAIVSRIFPPETRSTGLSISYNIPTTIFGGFAPAIVTYLIATTGNKGAPALYVIAAAAISLVSAIGLRNIRSQ